jgi:hypothetical protein
MTIEAEGRAFGAREREGDAVGAFPLRLRQPGPSDHSWQEGGPSLEDSGPPEGTDRHLLGSERRAKATLLVGMAEAGRDARAERSTGRPTHRRRALEQVTT